MRYHTSPLKYRHFIVNHRRTSRALHQFIRDDATFYRSVHEPLPRGTLTTMPIRTVRWRRLRRPSVTCGSLSTRLVKATNRQFITSGPVNVGLWMTITTILLQTMTHDEQQFQWQTLAPMAQVHYCIIQILSETCVGLCVLSDMLLRLRSWFFSATSSFVATVLNLFVSHLIFNCWY